MMPTEYRTLRHDEEEVVIGLWVDTFDESWEARERVFRDFADEPSRFARTHVAVAADGTILAATSYWQREMRDAKGLPCRTGHLWGVATRPEARRQGHARKLLDLTIQAMQQEGCLWSILFAREEARSLYTQAGWQSVPYTYRSGILAAQQIKSDTAYVMRAIDPEREAQAWARLTTIYAEANVERPLTLLRTQAYWQGYGAWILGDWMQNHCAVILVAAPTTEPDNWCGYVVAHFYNAAYAEQNFGSPPWFFISEVAARRDEPQATAALLHAVAQEAVGQEMYYGQMVLPDEPPINATLSALFGESLQGHDGQGSMMLRVLTADAPKLPLLDEQIPGFFWGLDHF